MAHVSKGSGGPVRLSIQAVLEFLIPFSALPLPVRIGPMLLIVGIVALLVLSIAGERFYARRPGATQMWRARVMFVLAATISAVALAVATVKWL